MDDDESVYFDDGRYFDWSCRNNDGTYQFEAGFGTEAVQVQMSGVDLTRLYAALGRTVGGVR